ncbi:hypothetical protein SH1V18_47820 [Vallitalea longa]|uniref:Flp pilus assembly protein TadB n=1 Tax=Vallitalea longa TaxID=2936439 RepID=A0A9W5YE57_9FIRM|nr:hypothetical protein [Vallitalea longa]GKX32302.1 hypothetical protein SH1V18_47820 [Vallitalea longa]
MKGLIKELYGLVTVSHLSVILTIIILILNAIIIIELVSRINIKPIFNKTLNSLKGSMNTLDRKAKRNLIKVIKTQMQEDYTIKLNLLETLDITLIQRSNIKRYIPFANVYTLITFQGCIFIGLFSKVYGYFYSIITTSLICAFLSFLPIAILDIMGQYNSNKIRKLVSDFLSVLNSFLEVKNNLVYALDKTIEVMPEPFNTYLIECVVQIKNGVDTEVALDLLSYKVNIKEFYNIILNLKQNIKCKGNTIALIRRLEEEAHMIEKEYTNRKMQNYINQIMLYIIMIVAVILVYYSIQVNETLSDLYLHTTEGKVILDISTIIFFMGFYWNIKIKKFDY